MIKQTESILSAIHISQQYGVNYLNKISKETVANVILNEPTVNSDTKKNPIYKKFLGHIMTLATLITVPQVIHEYYIPKAQDFLEIVESQISNPDEELSIPSIREKILKSFDEKQEQKSLPPSDNSIEEMDATLEGGNN